MADAAIREAFDKLTETFSSEDIGDFQSTTLQDVHNAAQAIERRQSQRQSLQNLRRIQPFLDFMQRYADVLEVICQGYSPIAWVWGPLKLLLQLASQYSNVFEKLIDAYKQIAEELPRIDRLRTFCGSDKNFSKALSYLYADVAEFHQRAYKFFRRKAWYMLFECSWKAFEPQFDAILYRIERHTELIDKEANCIALIETREAAKERQREVKIAIQEKQKEIDARVKQYQAVQLREVVQWISNDENDQEFRLEKLARHRQPQTCEWLLRNRSIASWLHKGTSKPIIWLSGIPGSGKSTCCARLVEYLQDQEDMASAYYFCHYSVASTDTTVQIMRSIAAQLIRRQPDIVPYVHQHYIDIALYPSPKLMRKLLREVLAGTDCCRIVVDGIDECDETQQRETLSTFLDLQQNAADSCKIVFASRNDENHIKALLRQNTIVPMKGQTDDAIRLFVNSKIAELTDKFESLDDILLDRIRYHLNSKADGMFLWVRLVAHDLLSQTTIQELEDALEKLPNGLDQAYRRILDGICKRRPQERYQTIKLLYWITCAFRPMKIHELRDGIAFRKEQVTPDERNRLQRNIVELCGPIIEELPGGIVDTVHFSAKEYLLHGSTGPFVKRSRAHHDIALSCVSFLNLRSTFIPGLHPNLTYHDLEEQVVTGYNGLDQYACRYWMNHVYEYMKQAGSLDMTSCPELINALLKLASFRRNSPATTLGSHLESQDGEEPCTETQSQKEVLALCSVPEVKNFLNYCLEFRQKLKDMESVLESPDLRSKWQHDNDPTWLSDVEDRVAAIIQRLLHLANSTITGHISVDQIRRFKTLYSSIGLHCRYSSCKYRCVTYRSETELRKHEFTHIRSYKCMDCDFAERPFASRQDLRKHQAKYHMTSVDFAVPLQIRSLATKSLPPLRRKTQRLGIRESNVGLSPIDQASPSDLRPTISNQMIQVHQNTQTTKEHAAMPKDLNLTDTSKRDGMETFSSAGPVSTSRAESGLAHKLVSMDKLKAVHSPEICSMFEAGFSFGEPIQKAPETAHGNSLRIDHVNESRHEPNTCNNDTSKKINVVHVENSTESSLRCEDGHSESSLRCEDGHSESSLRCEDGHSESSLRCEDGHSEGGSVESCVSYYVQLAAKVHLENHIVYGVRSTDEEARRIKGLYMGYHPNGTPMLLPLVCCSRLTCWSNFIGSYIDATFADENAIPGISERDIGEKLADLICGIAARGENTLYAFLDLRTKFLPQEMIRFERAMSHYGDAGTDLPTFRDKLRLWGPQRLKDYVERSLRREYLGVDEKDVYDWLYNYIREFSYGGSYMYRLTDEWGVENWVQGRRDAHSNLWVHICRFFHLDHDPKYRPLNIEDDQLAHYILSLLCKEKNPIEMVESLKEYLKPILNADLNLTSRKDTRMFVLELCMGIYTYSDLQTSIRIQYVALLESYVYDSYDSYVHSLYDGVRPDWPPPPRKISFDDDGTPRLSDGKPYGPLEWDYELLYDEESQNGER